MRHIKGILLFLQIAALAWIASILVGYPLFNQAQGVAKSIPALDNAQAVAFPTLTLSHSSTPTFITSEQASKSQQATNIRTPSLQPPETMCSPIKAVSIRQLMSYISDGYHPPPSGSDGRHMGVDFAFYRGQEGKEINGFEVNAVLPGIVAAVVFDRPPYGNMLIIETRYGDIDAAFADRLGITEQQSLYHLYAHLENAPSVDMGYEVYCEQFLGRVGSSGASVMPHLHFETRYGKPGARFSVLGYDSTASSQIAITDEEKENYALWRTSGMFQHFDPTRLFIVNISEMQ